MSQQAGQDILSGTFPRRVMDEKEFRLDRLVIAGVDNAPVFAVNVPDMPLQ